MPNTISFPSLCEVNQYRRVQIPRRIHSKGIERHRHVLAIGVNALRGNAIVHVRAEVL